MRYNFLLDSMTPGGASRVTCMLVDALHERGYDCRILCFSEPTSWHGSHPYVKVLSSVEDLRTIGKGTVIVNRAGSIALVRKYSPDSQTLYYCHGFETFALQHPSRSESLEKAMQLSDGVLAVSDKVKGELYEQSGLIAQVVSPYLKSSCFRKKESFSSPVRIITIGDPESNVKGIDILLSALQELHPIHKVQLQIISPSSSSQVPLESWEFPIQQYHQLSPEAVSSLLSESDILVCSSLYEGFSLAVLEASGCRLSIICTETAGIVSAMREAHAGICIPAADATALLVALKRVIEDVSFQEAQRENCVYLSEKFNVERTIQEFLSAVPTVRKSCNGNKVDADTLIEDLEEEGLYTSPWIFSRVMIADNELAELFSSYRKQELSIDEFHSGLLNVRSLLGPAAKSLPHIQKKIVLIEFLLGASTKEELDTLVNVMGKNHG